MVTTQDREGLLETLSSLLKEYLEETSGTLKTEELVIAPLASALNAVLMGSVGSVRSYLALATEALDR